MEFSYKICLGNRSHQLKLFGIVEFDLGLHQGNSVLCMLLIFLFRDQN